MSTSAVRGVSLALHTAQTTGNGLAIAIPPSFRNHTVMITGSAGVASGAVQPEVANSPLDTVWAPLGGTPVTAVVGAVVYTFEGVYKAFRARISTNIVGGNVTVTYTGY